MASNDKHDYDSQPPPNDPSHHDLETAGPIRWIDSIPFWPSYARSWLFGRRIVRVNLLASPDEVDRAVAALKTRGWTVSARTVTETIRSEDGLEMSVITATRQFRGYGGARSLVHEVAPDVSVALHDSGTVRSQVVSVKLDRPDYPILPEWRPDFHPPSAADLTGHTGEPAPDVVRARVFQEHARTVLFGNEDVTREHWQRLVGPESARLVPLELIPPRSERVGKNWERLKNARKWKPPKNAEFGKDLAYTILLLAGLVLGLAWGWDKHGGLAVRGALLAGGLALSFALELTSRIVERRALDKVDRRSIPFLMIHGGQHLGKPVRGRVLVLRRAGLLGLSVAMGMGSGWYLSNVHKPTGPLVYGAITAAILVSSCVIIWVGSVLARRAPRFRLPAAVVSLVFSWALLGQIPQLFFYSYLSGVGLSAGAIEVSRWEAFTAATRPMLGLLIFLIFVLSLYTLILSRLTPFLKTPITLLLVLMFLQLWIVGLGGAYDRGARLAVGAQTHANWGTTPRRVCLVATTFDKATGMLPRPMWLLGVKDGALVLLDPVWARDVAPPEDLAVLNHPTEAPDIRPHAPVVRIAAGTAAFEYLEDDSRCRNGEVAAPTKSEPDRA